MDSNEDTELLKEEAEHKPTSRVSENGMIFVILSLQCCSLSADTLIYPFFPVVAKRQGLTHTQTGLVFSSFDLARFLVSPIIGSMLTKWHPKRICIIGSLCTTTACIVFGTLELIPNKDWFFALCMVTRFSAGMGSAMLTVAATSIMMKTTSYKSSTIVALIEIMEGSAFALGPTYGSILFTVTGYSPMFWIAGAVMTIFLCAFVFLVPKVEEPDASQKSFLNLLTLPGCLIMFATTIVLRFNTVTRFTGISDWLITQYHTTPSFVGMTFTIYAGIYMLSCVLAGNFFKKGYTYVPLLVALVVDTILMFFCAPSHLLDFIFHGKKYLWTFVTAGALISIVLPFAIIPPFQAALNLLRVNGYQKDSLLTYGLVSGLINCGFSLGAVTAPVITGVITDHFDYSWAITLAAFQTLAITLVILIYWLYMRLTKQPLSPADVKENGDKRTDKENMAEKLANACDTKMKECLHDYESITQIHHQQPTMED